MNRNVFKFADVPVEITSLFPYVQNMCRDYVTQEKPQLFIEITPDDIQYERLKDKEANPDSGIDFPDTYLETLAVHRKLSTALLDHDVLLMHGSCLAIDGKAVLFTAKSGTGKSTHTRLWRQQFGERVIMVNDDKPFIRIGAEGEPALIYGTPWDGKHNLSRNMACSLHTIVRLMRGEENEIRPLETKDMITTFLQQVFCPLDSASRIKFLGLLSRLCQKVQFRELHCNMNPDAALVAYEGIFNF